MLCEFVSVSFGFVVLISEILFSAYFVNYATFVDTNKITLIIVPSNLLFLVKYAIPMGLNIILDTISTDEKEWWSEGSSRL